MKGKFKLNPLNWFKDPNAEWHTAFINHGLYYNIQKRFDTYQISLRLNDTIVVGVLGETDSLEEAQQACWQNFRAEMFELIKVVE